MLANDSKTAHQAVAIAKREINIRVAPETYDLLSYAYLASGDPQKALEIQEKYVEDKTFEPIAQLHLAQIYKELGMNEDLAPLQKDLLGASFELGPVTTKTVISL